MRALYIKDKKMGHHYIKDEDVIEKTDKAIVGHQGAFVVVAKFEGYDEFDGFPHWHVSGPYETEFDALRQFDRLNGNPPRMGRIEKAFADLKARSIN